MITNNSNYFPNEKQPLAPTRVRNKINNCIKNIKWKKEEDDILMKIMLSTDHLNYSKLEEQFPGKTGQQISERWDKVLNPNLIKGSWTREEDEKIIKFVNENGSKNWSKLSLILKGRIGKQCRERWRNHLDPNINHNSWTKEEDELILKYRLEYGNKWVKIASLLKNRSDNAVKNRWNATLKKLIPDPLVLNIPDEELLKNNQSPNSTPNVYHHNTEMIVLSPEIISLNRLRENNSFNLKKNDNFNTFVEMINNKKT